MRTVGKDRKEMIRTTKRASDLREAVDEIGRAAGEGRARRACLANVRAANMTGERARTDWRTVRRTSSPTPDCWRAQ